jgi:hypothetical protein
MSLATVNEVQDNLDVDVRLLKPVTVLSGQNLARGALVKFDAVATTKVVSFTNGADPYTVMYEAVDATGGDKVGLAYRAADIKASEVNFGTGADTAAVRDALDAKGIYLRD